MNRFIPRWVHRVAPLAACALALGGGYALAQQMIGPQTKPPSDKEVQSRKEKGGYFPERMKNPNLSAHASRMTVTLLALNFLGDSLRDALDVH